MRGVSAAFHNWDVCQQKNCKKPSIYRVYKPGEVNRFFCGNHSRKYFDRNAGAMFASKLTGVSNLPYKIQVLEEVVPKLTWEEKARLVQNGATVIWINYRGRLQADSQIVGRWRTQLKILGKEKSTWLAFN